MDLLPSLSNCEVEHTTQASTAQTAWSLEHVLVTPDLSGSWRKNLFLVREKCTLCLLVIICNGQVISSNHSSCWPTKLYHHCSKCYLPSDQRVFAYLEQMFCCLSLLKGLMGSICCERARTVWHFLIEFLSCPPPPPTSVRDLDHRPKRLVRAPDDLHFSLSENITSFEQQSMVNHRASLFCPELRPYILAMNCDVFADMVVISWRFK